MNTPSSSSKRKSRKKKELTSRLSLATQTITSIVPHPVTPKPEGSTTRQATKKLKSDGSAPNKAHKVPAKQPKAQSTGSANPPNSGPSQLQSPNSVLPSTDIRAPGQRPLKPYTISALLQHELFELTRSFHASETARAARSSTIQRVTQVINHYYGQEYTVELFGSTCYGVSSPKSDLDMVIIDQERPHGFSPTVSLTELPVIYDIEILANHLRTAGFTNVRAVSGAAVPIVKFHDPNGGLDCDVNVNEQLGCMNTALLNRYCDISPHLRTMIGFIKKWAKSKGLNDSSGRAYNKRGKQYRIPSTFSSYSLALLTIGFLQIRGLLPNLQEGFEPLGTFNRPTEGEFWTRVNKGTSSLRCDARFNQRDDWIAVTRASTYELIVEWFDFWGNEFNYDQTLLDIRRGGVLERKKREPRKPKSKAKATDKDEAYDNKTAEVIEKQDLIGVADRIRPAGLDLDLEADETVTKDEEKIPEVDLNEHEEVDDGVYDLHMVQDDEPSNWRNNAICIVDPFIRQRNTTASISVTSLKKFQAACKRAAMIISTGGSLASLVADKDDEARRQNQKSKPKKVVVKQTVPALPVQ